MEQSPSLKANMSLAGQEIPHILWNLKVHYCIPKRLLPGLYWAWLKQSVPPHPVSWRSILMSSSHLYLGLPSGFFHSGLLTKTIYAPLLVAIHATCPTHLIILDFIPPHNFIKLYESIFICEPTNLSVFSSHVLCNYIRKLCRPKLLV